MTLRTLDIIQIPNKILRQTAEEIKMSDIPTPRIQNIIQNMKNTLKNTPDGVGLAAPQVGESLRLFIVSDEAEEIDRAEERYEKAEQRKNEEPREGKPYPVREWNYYVFINPTIKNISKSKNEGAEGCLSVRGTYGMVKRKDKITVEAYNETGKKFTRGASRFFARVIQHELDHLDGVLFIDKVEKYIQSE